jgi:quercetin dioxygenase-like cupin family protein
MATDVRDVLHPTDGERVNLLALGVRFLLDGERTGGRVAVVEHPLPARSLGSPLHTHHNEDEYSFVLEGRLGVQLGNDTFEVGPGDFVAKPRGVEHAFWNPTDEPARLLELITPAGFEDYFRDLAPLLAAATRDDAAVAEVRRRYGLDLDPASAPVLAQRHGLRLG